MPADPPPSLRAAVERRSVPVLAWLRSRPRWLPALAAVALLAGVVLLPAALAVLCLVALLAALAWLSFLSWPVLSAPARGLRLGALAVLVLVGLRAALA